MSRFPKITPGQPSTYNRKFRRALRSNTMRNARGKRRFALLSNLVGGQRADDHESVVAAFMLLPVGR
jgi:hypothetical protein